MPLRSDIEAIDRPTVLSILYMTFDLFDVSHVYTSQSSQS